MGAVPAWRGYLAGPLAYRAWCRICQTRSGVPARALPANGLSKPFHLGAWAARRGLLDEVDRPT